MKAIRFLIFVSILFITAPISDALTSERQPPRKTTTATSVRTTETTKRTPTTRNRTAQTREARNTVSRRNNNPTTVVRTATNRQIASRGNQETIARTATSRVLTTRQSSARTTQTTNTNTNQLATARARNAVQSLQQNQTAIEICKNLYNECMDNYCNVLDDTKGRCSCSKNLNNYKKQNKLWMKPMKHCRMSPNKFPILG